MNACIITLPNEISTLNLGMKLGCVCDKVLMMYLYGDLGTGKTTFSRGFLRAFGYNGHVKSPTYTLVESYYLGSITLYHFDLYRLNNIEELEFIGIHDYFNSNALCLVEWPQLGIGILPEPDLVLTLRYVNTIREAEIFSLSKEGKIIIRKFKRIKDLF
ncbi:tRNA (adenosine(37)-N6)-threonylcarbamoyltransferase complex ATPase subunit type 1 TsaE [Candidatus Pantoea carbekii]|uniref:tRNA threonylcarbamoyladenosine biosynthesis protein TsaE n=1 Tax=Candidatus Pantoea carbekii TaxID=1235990 RepID=U3U7K2_9GAMM|nr:tRNA (adenosine(37)-N6)-threonylcarbamoyltransferase complex ATPase subunit type 1 TsaE [Candidatus Pantoea carbekii]AKC32517.1 hypothetical protein BMSBPS_0746 [Candidatus Pantoea carbekii]BAO00244.1 hypothetical protein HHS_02740 [Candidatus Pantoea carbekii]